MTATTAKKDYKMTEADLQTLQVTYKQNPYYRSAAPMRLYVRTEVEQLASDKARKAEIKAAEEQAFYAEHKDEIDAAAEENRQQKVAIKKTRDAENAAKRQCKKSKAAEEAKNALAQITSNGSLQLSEGGSNYYLPTDVWVKILTLACGSVNNGLQVKDVTQRLAIFRTICKELYSSCQIMLLEQDKFCKQLKGDVKLWEALLQNPTKLKVQQLKSLAKMCKLPVSDPKPLLIVNLLKYLGIKHPTNIPPALFHQIRREKKQAERDKRKAERDRIKAEREAEEEAYDLERRCVSCCDRSALACPNHQCWDCCDGCIRHPKDMFMGKCEHLCFLFRTPHLSHQ